MEKKVWNYVVTAHKPTAVTHSLVGNFTHTNQLNLILGKGTRVEIHGIGPEGLVPMLDVGIYGRISTMLLYRPIGEEKDLLFLCTERYRFCVLGFDAESGEIVTRANGDLSERIGRPADVGQIGIIDPDCRLIALHLYDGLLKVIPMESKGTLKEAFNIRLEELQVIDIKFLYKCSKPTFAILYQDTREARHVKTYQISTSEKDHSEGEWSQSNVENGASMLIAVPFGGVLIIGEQTITYHNGAAGYKSIAMKPTLIKSYAKIDADGHRYLLGDHQGRLLVLVLEQQGSKLTDMKIEYIGETSISTSISYIDNGVVFIGSAYGDSQLIRLKSEKDEETGSCVEVLESFTNLGPIVDFCVVDLERQGQGQIVTCSGGFKDGSLRIIRNGIGINEQAASELPGIKGIWALRASSDSEHDKYIVLSFVGETRVLSITGEELEETEIAGFQSDEQTLFCGNTLNNQFIQITGKSIQLVDCKTLECVGKWKPMNDITINAASFNANQILIGAAGGNLIYLEIEGNALKEINKKTLEHEIACVNINNFADTTKPASVCAVGMWTDITVRLLSVPTLDTILKEPLGGEIIPRSILLTSFEGTKYLFCTIADGHLFSFTLHPESLELRDKKKVTLGTKPILLNTFQSNGVTHVFASSDRPTVIYTNNNKLLFSNVNLKEVNYMSAFNSESFPDSLVIATEEGLSIGTIDDIQKLHIRSVPLGEMPRRIAHQESSNTLCVLTVSTSTSATGEESETCFIRLIDAHTFEVVDSCQLNEEENGCSVISCRFKEDSSNEYYVIGTAYAIPTEAEPTKGRLLVFSVVDHKLKFIHELTATGAVYSLNSFNGNLLAGINSTIQLYKWSDKEGNKQLTFECAHRGHILALFIACRGDFIVVGDLMKSISLLLYKAADAVIEEIARDYNPSWMTAVEILDDDTYIGAENSFNIFTVKRNSEAATDEERSRLEVCGQYHLGEFINRFRHGSLVMKVAEGSDALNLPTLIYGTINGAVGVIASLPHDLFTFFEQLQHCLTQVIKGVGGFSHAESFSNERKTVPAKNFIDGDLIESFLDLKRDKMNEVAKSLSVSVEELTKRIEALQQAIH